MPTYINRLLQRHWLVHLLFITGLILVTVSGTLFFFMLRQTKKNTKDLAHTYEVLLSNTRIVSTLRAQEAYCRGYVIRQDTALLNNYYRFTERTWLRCRELESKIQDNATQKINVATLRNTLTEKQATMDSMIDFAGKDRGMVQRLLVKSNQLTDKMMIRSRNINTEERRLMDQRTESLKTSDQLVSRFGALSFSVAIFFLLLGYMLSLLQSRGIRTINTFLEDSNRELEAKVVERTKDLQVQINLRNQEIARKNQEVEEARRFQLSLIPTLELPENMWEVGAHIWPAEDVGGDYYDYKISDNEQELLLALGDAAGHGLMAAMIVSNVHSYWHGFADVEPAEKLMTRISNGLSALKLQMAIMAMAVIRVRPGKLEITSAAMPPFLLYRAHEDILETITIRSMFLGSSMSGGYHTQTMTFRPGDLFLAASDGLIEARNSNGDFYGLHRIKDCLLRNKNQPVDALTEAIYDDLRAFSGNQPQHDDVTILAIRMRS